MKIETIRNKLAKVAPGTTLGPFEIDLGYTRTDPTFQVRFRLDDANKARLRAAYKSGAEVAPITLAFIEGGDGWPIIIDGHHRVTVLETLAAEARVRGGEPFKTVKAIVVSLSRDEARFQAAIANTKHGLNVTGKESRRVFGRYVETGRHRNADGSYKSYREIGKELARTHNTVSKWMKADFPEEARKMMNEDMVKTGGVGAPVPLRLVKHEAQAKLLELKTLFEQGYSDERQGMIEGLWSLLDDMERVHARTNHWLHDDRLNNGSMPQQNPDADF